MNNLITLDMNVKLSYARMKLECDKVGWTIDTTMEELERFIVLMNKNREKNRVLYDVYRRDREKEEEGMRVEKIKVMYKSIHAELLTVYNEKFITLSGEYRRRMRLNVGEELKKVVNERDDRLERKRLVWIKLKYRFINRDLKRYCNPVFDTLYREYWKRRYRLVLNQLRNNVRL